MQNKTVDQIGLISAAQTLSRITSENKPHTHCSEGEGKQRCQILLHPLSLNVSNENP